MELWINALLPIKVFNVAILIAAILMFSHGLPKKDHFQRRLFLWALFSLFAAAAILIITDSLWYVTSVFLVMYLLSMLTVRICSRVSWPMVFFIAAAVMAVCGLLMKKTGKRWIADYALPISRRFSDVSHEY